MNHVFRSLARSPGFALVSILTVALGIGSATAIYSVTNAVVLRPLAFRDDSTLAWVWSTRPDRDRAFFSIPHFLDLQRANTTANLAAISPLGVTLTGMGEPERVLGWRVTTNLFSILGTKPELGRLPQPGDDAAPVAVFSYGYWQRRFGGDPQIIGRTVTLNGIEHTIVGILPPQFTISSAGNDIIIAQPLETDPRRADRGFNFLRMIARLKPGVTMAQAQAEFAALTRRIVRQYPDTDGAITAPRFVPLREEIVGGYRASLLMLLAAAAALLLIMCANLAGLLAARAMAKRRDAALCAALGASPARLMKTYLTEGFVIAVVGGAIGVGACIWGKDVLLALAPQDLPRTGQVAVNLGVLAVALGCTLLTGLAIGLTPALRLARIAPQDVLKSGSPSVTERAWGRAVLVAIQVALCAALLIGTGLLVRSLRKVLESHPGFVTSNVLVAQVALAGRDYPNVAETLRMLDEYDQCLAALPGVRNVAATSVLPLTGINTRSEFVRPDRPLPKPSDTFSAANRFITENFFDTLGIPLLAGRDFRRSDDHSSRPVAIIDHALAEQYWPGEDPLGKTIRINDSLVAPPGILEVVGVVGTTKNFTLEESGTPTLYLPVRQMAPSNLAIFLGRVTFVARTGTPPLAFANSARNALRAIDHNAAVSFRSYDEVIAWARAPRIFSVQLLGFFSAMAVLLAVIGLYAITAQAVAARTREIGLRMALGADRLRIARHVAGGVSRMVLTGLAFGVVLSASASPWLGHMVYGVSVIDPMTYATVIGVLTAVALAAVWLPVRRAMAVDPIVALKTE